MEAMGADDRLPAAALIARLQANPQRFDLFQAISLLERAVPSARPLGRGNGLGEGVRLTGHVSLAFEPSDVRRVQAHTAADAATPDYTPDYAPRAAWTLTTPVLTLAGANGPLPVSFTELVLERRAKRDHATADLLDIFNHRFLSFLYRSRKKHAPGLNWRSPHASALAGALDALSNLGLRAGVRGPEGVRLWMRHAGLMSAAPRSMSGLVALLSDRLCLTVRGTQFEGGWRELDRADALRLARAGSGAPRLTSFTVLGQRTWDQASGISLVFPDLSKEHFDALLPGGRLHALAAWLTRAYLQQDLEVHFVLHLAPQRTACEAGGPRASRLGWTSWLGGSRGSDLAPAPVRLALRETPAAAPTNS